ncbi:glycoside hydrolase family 63 protein [Xylona heveae TC161]|uniref:Mannosyl-oligosaccharide glucosidase n=1 Tax=Xylona heveae (strain CBS 132557 / TC161) TaxID=1328760 RepID=A0A165FU24_XYLHT|nr:glycoside hydrolase family 63 protein [Xylona heveae TC161]KZF21381.1 glycoside hydrolase family 63 protein [Xylona heveae TC161]
MASFRVVPTVWALCLLLLGLLTFSPTHAAEDTSILINEIARASNDSLLWGPYRPNLYFGVRPRIPKSLMTGLLWAKVDNFIDVQNNFRYTCEQHEGMAGYGWDEYDVRTGGRQTVHDAGNKVDLTTEFIKVPGGVHGGSWGLRIKGTPRKDAPAQLKTSVVFYAALEGLGSLQVENDINVVGYKDVVTLGGDTPELGKFTINVTRGPETNTYPKSEHPAWREKPLNRTIVHSFQYPEEMLWQIKPIMFQNMKSVVDGYIEKYGTEKHPMPEQTFTLSQEPGPGNMHMIQKVFTGAFEFDVLFTSGSAPNPITSDLVTKEISAVTDSFSKRFSKIFEPKAPFNKPKYLEFGKSLFSNLIGGIGYFYGDAVVDRSYAPEYDEENEGFWEEAAEARTRGGLRFDGPNELFTSVPSRPFFPRGFLWDEGFHLLPVADWDIDLTLAIVKSWFGLMDEDGWIGREQILGHEARSKVPAEFQAQYPHYANPPTLFFVLDAFIDKLLSNRSTEKETLQPENLSGDIYSTFVSNPEVALQYLRNLYPLLKRHYFWFRKTQWGDVKSYDREAYSTREAYRWRGRTPDHILTSGIDDYPRAQPPHPGELHVDLISWMGTMTRSIKRIAEVLGETEDASEFADYEKGIVRNIDDLHWDEAEQTYCDATIDDYEESVHVCHKGYVSIMPFLVGLLPADSPRLGAVLDLIADPEQLWSDHGIRSLSKGDVLYGTKENYWRSPVWININYLALVRLLEYANTQGPHQARAKDLYTRLRLNLVETVYDSWSKTGFAWEQYNPETGAGQRTQHFTGWTSLVVKIMNMPDLSKSTVGKINQAVAEVLEAAKAAAGGGDSESESESESKSDDAKESGDGHDEL